MRHVMNVSTITHLHTSKQNFVKLVTQTDAMVPRNTVRSLCWSLFQLQLQRSYYCKLKTKTISPLLIAQYQIPSNQQMI